ncbi:hypothetical protein CEXT_630861 [Caerostris extrusa]|uniref:Uncharacterized protein n=1 Tax=Caerostris extrusa TaxID=172846 RepID=A0AAV4Q6C1_CAEEX|nr:hypothetical protein CEXT_630861 [Caerostris extrusa]
MLSWETTWLIRRMCLRRGIDTSTSTPFAFLSLPAWPPKKKIQLYSQPRRDNFSFLGTRSTYIFLAGPSACHAHCESLII